MAEPILTAPPAAPPAGGSTPPVAPPAGTTAPPATSPPATQAPPAAPPATAPTTYDLMPSKPGALPDAAIAQVAEIAKDLGLSQEAAQKLLARHESAFATHQAAQQEARAKQSDAWYDELAADKELGGANLQKTIDAARKGLAVLTESERETIAKAGFQNHPILVKLLAREGARLGEGDIGGTPGQHTAQKLYPSMPNP